jgi:hypothetical protein
LNRIFFWNFFGDSSFSSDECSPFTTKSGKFATKSYSSFDTSVICDTDTNAPFCWFGRCFGSLLWGSLFRGLFFGFGG